MYAARNNNKIQWPTAAVADTYTRSAGTQIFFFQNFFYLFFFSARSTHCARVVCTSVHGVYVVAVVFIIIIRRGPMKSSSTHNNIQRIADGNRPTGYGDRVFFFFSDFFSFVETRRRRDCNIMYGRRYIIIILLLYGYAARRYTVVIVIILFYFFSHTVSYTPGCSGTNNTRTVSWTHNSAPQTALLL